LRKFVDGRERPTALERRSTLLYHAGLPAAPV